MSLSKNQLKLITSLHQKKYRTKHNLFVVEGPKVVNEFLASKFELEKLYCTDETMYEHYKDQRAIISENELKKISNLKTPNKVLALFRIPASEKLLDKGLILALDEINDPGNMGTIIRLCDWFGVDQLVCSLNTVDCYNNKVVQSTMGSLTRVSVVYVNLKEYLKNTSLNTYATLLEGENVYKTDLEREAVLVLGNEANGIRLEIQELLEHKITIPQFGNVQQTESLNVASATAVLLSEFRRRI